MRFAAPAALVLLAFVVLLFLARRRMPRRRVTVANLYLWSEESRRDRPAIAPRLRRHHWLLIAQAAFLAVLAVAVAGPMVQWDERPFAVLLDTSLSMRTRAAAGTRIDAARDRARALAAGLPRGSRIRLFTLDAEPRFVGEFGARDSRLAAAIDAVRPTDASADVIAGIQSARAGDPPPQRIYVISDGAPPATPPADIAWESVGEPADNAAITALTSRPARAGTQVLVTMRNTGRMPVDTTVIVRQAGADVARAPVRLLPQRDAATSIVLPNPGGVIEARLETDDALAADNVRATIAPSTLPVRTRLLSESFFLTEALATDPAAAVTDAEPFEVVVCDRCAEPPAGAAGVILIQRGEAATSSSPLVSTGATHPLMDGVLVDGVPATLFRLNRVPDEATVLARAGGLPAVLTYEIGGRRVVELRIDPDGGGFPLSTAFPVLMANAIEWAAGRARNPATIEAGTPLQWHLAEQRASPVVQGPDGAAVQTTFSAGVLSIAGTQAAGTYRVMLDAGESLFVVNPAAARESSLEGMRVSVPEREAGPASTGGSPYTDVTTIVLIAGFVLLAVEWHLRTRETARA